MSNDSELDLFLKEELKELPSFNEIKKELAKDSIIEKLGEEEFVIKSLFRGKDRTWIISEIEKKHNEKISIREFDKFMEKNANIVQYVEKERNLSAKRIIDARVDVENKVASLILFTEELIKKYDAEGDSQSTVAALNVLNKTIMNYAKLAGMLEPEEKKEVRNVINIISDRNHRLVREVISADFKMVEDEKEDDGTKVSD